MSDLTTCADTRSAISSPALADGQEPCASQAGPMTDLFGPVPVLANLSPSQARDLGLMTRDTSGLIGTGSSNSDALQRSLENRLRQRLTGSVSCEITWKPWNTPWGQCLSKPRAQVRSTFEIVIGLWPTARANEGTGPQAGPNRQGSPSLRELVLALYPTATTPSGGQTLPDGTSMSRRRPDGSKAQVTLQNVLIAMWSTIRASDGAKGGPNMSFGAGGSPLPSQVSTVASTSNAPTESGGGSLHPEFAGWEMGYPPEWLSCASSETRSTRARRQRSSKHTTT